MKNKDKISLDLLKDIISNTSDQNLDASELDNMNFSEETLFQFANLHAVPPPPNMREKILSKIQKLCEQQSNIKTFTLDSAPLLTPDTNWLNWVEAVKDIEEPSDFENVHLHCFRNDDVAEMFVAWVKKEVPEEVHHDFLESFILLEGSCECHITGPQGSVRIVKMREGDYISFKIGEVHDIQITSTAPAKAILQWLKLAA